MLQYSVDNIKVSFLGIPLHRGLADGTFVAFTNNNQSWEWISDGLGGGIRIANEDRSGICSITLETESKEHAVLLGLATADRINQSVVGPLIVSDFTNGQTFICSSSYITDEPDEQRATSSISVTWNFHYTEKKTIPGLLGSKVGN